MSIVVSNVPLDTRVPGVFIGIDGSRANSALPGMPRRILLLGDKTSAGTAAFNTPIRILDAGEAASLFGPGSSLEAMIKAARTHNQKTELWAMAGVSGTNAATLTIEVTGANLESYGVIQKDGTWSHTLNFVLGGSPIPVNVDYDPPGTGNADAGDFAAAAAAYAALITTAIGAYATVSVVGPVITITADVAAIGAWSMNYSTPMASRPVLRVNGYLLDGTGSYFSHFFLAAEGAGSAAIGSVSVVVSSPAAGTLSLYVAGTRVAVSVLPSDTATSLAARIAAAINANHYLPVTASAALGVVTLTAKWAGASGNGIDLRVNVFPDQTTPSGVTVSLSQLAGGAGIPEIEDMLAAVGEEWFTCIVSAWADGSLLTSVEAWLENRDGPMDPLPGHIFAALDSNLAGLVSAGSARNSKQSTLFGCYGVPQPPYVWSASVGAACEYEAALDPARPLQQVPLQLMAPAIPQRLTRDERETLLNSGISTFTVTSTGEVYLERVITTYQESGLGIPDVTWLDLETVNTLQYIRYAVRTRIASAFPRMKLADDGTQFASGQPIVTPSVIRAEMIALFLELEAIGLVEGFDQFKADLQVERSTQDRNRVNVLFPPDIINQLRVTAGTVQFRL